MNRGILALGVVSAVAMIGFVFVYGIFAALACMDSCSSALASAQRQPEAILVFFLWLAPALALTLAGWLWQLDELRRMGARNLLAFAASFPVIALVIVGVVTLSAAASDGVAPLAFTPMHLWRGEFGLVVWPLLVSVVALVRRRRVGVASAAPVIPPGPTHPTT